MHSLLERLEIMESRIKRLAEKLEESQNECDALKQENARLEQALTECRSSLKSSGNEGDGRNGQNGNKSIEIDSIKSKIDRYINEIDQCVEQLNEMREV